MKGLAFVRGSLRAWRFADSSEVVAMLLREVKGEKPVDAGKNKHAVLDRYGGYECLWLRVGPMERAGLLASPGWFESPYDPRRTALCCRLESIDWRRMRALVRRSHSLAAPHAGTRWR